MAFNISGYKDLFPEKNDGNQICFFALYEKDLMTHNKIYQNEFMHVFRK